MNATHTLSAGDFLGLESLCCLVWAVAAKSAQYFYETLMYG